MAKEKSTAADSANPPAESAAAPAPTGATADAPATVEARADETIPGGIYRNADGSFKNAHGQRIDESGKVLKAAPAEQSPAAE